MDIGFRSKVGEHGHNICEGIIVYIIGERITNLIEYPYNISIIQFLIVFKKKC